MSTPLGAHSAPTALTEGAPWSPSALTGSTGHIPSYSRSMKCHLHTDDIRCMPISVQTSPQPQDHTQMPPGQCTQVARPKRWPCHLLLIEPELDQGMAVTTRGEAELLACTLGNRELPRKKSNCLPRETLWGGPGASRRRGGPATPVSQPSAASSCPHRGTRHVTKPSWIPSPSSHRTVAI